MSNMAKEKEKELLTLEEQARIRLKEEAKVEAELAVKEKSRKRKLSPEEIHVKTDSKLNVQFTNLETPGGKLEFTYGGMLYAIEDGETLKLPVCVIDHLNNLQQRIRVYDSDAPEGQQCEKVRMVHRFHLVEVKPKKK